MINPAFQGLTATGVTLLLLDAIFVVMISLQIVTRLSPHERHVGIVGVRLAVMCAFVVVASVWLGSALTMARPWFFLLLHAAVTAGLWVSRDRKTGRRVGLYLSQIGILMGWAGRKTSVARLAGSALILAVLAYALVLAVGTFAGNYDSQTYRLSRVGYWLQEGGIRMHFANSDRLWYMPVNTECVMLWLTSFFPYGYPLVKLAQFFGGILAVLSMVEMGRLVALPRQLRLLAVALFLGMPNVYLQFATSQSDLFTAGLLSAGLVFVWRSIRELDRTDPWFAGLALGLAFGAKSTPVYWVPGLVLWIALLIWPRRAAFRAIGSYALIAATVACVIGGWKYLDNFYRYGNPFAPETAIEAIHQKNQTALVDRVVYVAGLHLWQLLQPNSNPRFLSPLVSTGARPLERGLKRDGPTAAFTDDFRSIETLYTGQAVYEDIVSFGIVGAGLAFLGAMVVLWRWLRRRDRHAWELLAMAVSLAAFFGFFFTQQNPNAWNYRFFVLLAPFLAILGASLFQPIRVRWPVAGGWLVAVLFATQIYGAVDFQARNVLGGWKALAHPKTLGNLPLFNSLRDDIDQLSGRDKRIALALPDNDWLAPYFRTKVPRRVEFIDLADLRRDFETPAAFLKAKGYDVLITRPDVFPRNRWTGTEAKANDLAPPFARVCFEVAH